MSEARHVRIDLGYDGRRFFGSQRQKSVRTVQEELENALAHVTRHETRLAFAGRTDRGVHAVGQVASGSVEWSGDLERLRYALDSLTATDLAVYDVREVGPQFHARFSAVRREYRYRIFISSSAPVLLNGLVWQVRSALDIDRMNAASARLIGQHDFRTFAGAGLGAGESNTETRRDLDIAEWQPTPNIFEPRGRMAEFRVRANAFLPHMVRNIVGALVEVGTGSQRPDLIERLLEIRDRKHAPPPAPPDGLTLWSIDYSEGETRQEPGQIAGLEQE